ncbi:zinc finger protein 845 [Nephila pilipes]|uniref:Zinc finger protein 845 n=1 Tax=Nephila pilipes TaxID=299642 RepID=A0A8X6QCN5_NEPPI|nr:zinc finger protein 845 [Nephila pilipes]
MACEICHKSYILTLEDGQIDSDAKPHVCTTCGQSFSLKIQLKRHTLLHANGAPFVCINCKKDSENEESKTYNLRLAKKNEGYACDSCKESFSSKRLLFRHTAKEHTFVNTYTCDDCPECFESASELRKHASIHKVKVINKRNLSKIDVRGEDSSEEKLTKPYSKKLSCQNCNKSFAYLACLDKHLIKCNGKPISTSHASISSKKVRPSVKISYSGDKKHECNICGKSFTRKSALEGHEVSHLKEKFDSPYEEYSDSSLHGEESDDYDLPPKKPRLSKINIKKSFTCDSCNFVCFSNQTLIKHINNHRAREENPFGKNQYEDSEDEDDDRQQCPKCDKKFSSITELEKHSLIHIKKENEKKSKIVEDEEGDYPCEICEKFFNTKRRLKKHLLFHVTRNREDNPMKWAIGRKQRSKDYACEMCGKRFAGETCLKKHMQKHESGELKEKKPKRTKKEKIIQTLICEFCNEEFTGRRGAYIKHLHSHTPEVCGICDERFVDRQGLREHCKIHIGTEEGRMFMECSQKALDAKNGLLPPEPKVEYIYLVLR